MPEWTAESGGGMQLRWTSLDDFINWLNSTVAPSAAQYGYRVVVEPIPKDEVAIDRA